jgi:hypothetical protein
MQRQNSNRAKNSQSNRLDQLSTESRAFKRASQILENAVREKWEAKPQPRGTLMAELFQEQNRAIETLMPSWKRRMILQIIDSTVRKINREDRAQQYLPGFEMLPDRPTIGNRRQRLLAATEPIVCELLAQEEARRRTDTPRMKKYRELIELMRKYTPKEPEITAGEVFEREAR